MAPELDFSNDGSEFKYFCIQIKSDLSFLHPLSLSCFFFPQSDVAGPRHTTVHDRDRIPGGEKEKLLLVAVIHRQYRFDHGRFPVSASRLGSANPASVSSSETGVNLS
jgi:hypothetical protein